jgi:hypothetical protein
MHLPSMRRLELDGGLATKTGSLVRHLQVSYENRDGCVKGSECKGKDSDSVI